MDNVAIFHYIVSSLGPELAGGAGAGLAAVADEVVEGDDLGADEGLFKICVDDRRIGLGVGQDNLGARRLYERLGYREAGLAPYVVRSFSVDGAGQRHPTTEVCLYLIKSLSHP